MRQERQRGPQGASAGGEEVLIECRLFNDLITERLCTLRKQELSTAWNCSCSHAKRAGARAVRTEPSGLPGRYRSKSS